MPLLLRQLYEQVQLASQTPTYLLGIGQRRAFVSIVYTPTYIYGHLFVMSIITETVV